MTKQEREPVRFQYMAGLENGRAIANKIIMQFPKGFDDDVGGEIRQIEDKALAHVIDKLTANGVEEEYRAPFAEGFTIGLKNTYGGLRRQTHHPCFRDCKTNWLI